MQIKTGWILNNLSISQLDDLSSKFNWFPGDLSKCDRNSIEKDGILLPLLVQHRGCGHRVDGPRGTGRRSLTPSPGGQALLNRRGTLH